MRELERTQPTPHFPARKRGPRRSESLAGARRTCARRRPARRRRSRRASPPDAARSAGGDAILLCVPDAEIPAAAHDRRRRRAVRRPRERRHAAQALEPPACRPSGSTRSRRSRGPDASTPSRAVDVPSRAPPSGLWARRRQIALAPGDGAVRDRRQRAARLPRRRLDRLELPRDARGRGGGAWPRGPASSPTRLARLLGPSCAPRWRTGSRSDRRPRSPGRWPAATRPPSPPSAPPWREAAPNCRALRRARARARASGAGAPA